MNGKVVLSLLLVLLLNPGLTWSLDRVYLSHSAIAGPQAFLAVTRDAGLFRKYDLDPQIVFIAGGPVNIAALASGEVQFAIVAGPAVISANVQGADVVVPMSFVNSWDLSLFAHPSIKKPADLKGKKIGISAPGSTNDFGGRLALKKWGLQADKEVAMLAVGAQPQRFAALQVGRVDATLLQPPFTLKARQAGFSDLGSLGDLGLDDYLATCIATTRTIIQKNEQLVRRVVKVFVEGIHFFKTNKEASMRSIAKFTKIDDAAAVEEAYNTYGIKLLPRVPYPTTRGIEVILEDLAIKNPKARGLDPRRFMETRFLKELEDSGFINQLYKQ
jgi:NitT/TauT family transport system substrate-binding protein